MRTPLANILLCSAVVGIVLLLTACGEQLELCQGADGRPIACTNSFVCTNGIPTEGTARTRGVESCTSCNSTFKLINNRCNEQTRYTCGNGTPEIGNPSGNSDVERCANCDSTYKMINNLSTPALVVQPGQGSRRVIAMWRIVSHATRQE